MSDQDYDDIIGGCYRWMIQVGLWFEVPIYAESQNWPEGSQNGPRPKAQGYYGCAKPIPRPYHYKQLLTYLLIGS